MSNKVTSPISGHISDVSTLDVRRYGASNAPYTPLGTTCLPRPGWKNDTLSIADGITGVVLQDSSVARVDATDYQRLQDCGWVARWTSRKVTGNNFYPSVNHGDRIRPVARLILNAGNGEKVKYRDGNQLNLTRANLILMAKGSREIDGSNRKAPIAPVLCNAESRRAAARVSASVGHASPAERVATATQAVRKAITQPQAALLKGAA